MSTISAAASSPVSAAKLQGPEAGASSSSAAAKSLDLSRNGQHAAKWISAIGKGAAQKAPRGKGGSARKPTGPRRLRTRRPALPGMRVGRCGRWNNKKKPSTLKLCMLQYRSMANYSARYQNKWMRTSDKWAKEDEQEERGQQ